MKKILSASFLLFILAACNNSPENQAPPAESENDLDAARTFIRSSLDGNMDEAMKYLLKDSTNLQYFELFENKYNQLDRETKRSYRESSINIHDTKKLNDSTSVIIYSNSYRNDKDTLKLVLQNHNWLVDLKYLFLHDQETPAPGAKTSSPTNPDSLK